MLEQTSELGGAVLEEGRACATTTVLGTAEIITQFEIPSGTYLFSHAVGPLTRAGRAAAQAQLDVWAAEGCDAWGPWLQDAERFRAELAALLGGSADEWVPQANVSAGLVKLIGSLPRRRGRDRIVISELDFPTVGHVALAARKLGYRVDFASRGEAGDHDPRLEALGDDVQLLVWTHAYPDVGLLAEPPRREQLGDAFLAVDVCQSAGVAPISVGDWDADFVVGSCVKWLCGGPGAGFLWVRPDLLPELEPSDAGWFSRDNPFDFDIHSAELAPDARRFWGGTPSTLPLAIAAAGLELIRSIGIAPLRAWNQRLVGRLLDGAAERGLRIVSPADPQRRSGTAVIDCGDNQAALNRLREAGIRADKRRYGLRLSPHCFNTEAQIDAALAAL